MLSNIIKNLKYSFYTVAVIWVVYLLNLTPFFPDMTRFGIEPRSVNGLFGVFLAPFLHHNFLHIVSNTGPMLILPIIIKMIHGHQTFIKIFVAGTLFSGLATWVFSASNSLTVGASGVVFTMIGFLIGGAFIKPSIINVIATSFTVVLYSGAFFSLFSFIPGVSWIAHLSGFITGMLMAYLMLRCRGTVRFSPKQ
jgi:membrane associated rhomboid family serine protease